MSSMTLLEGRNLSLSLWMFRCISRLSVCVFMQLRASTIFELTYILQPATLVFFEDFLKRQAMLALRSTIIVASLFGKTTGLIASWVLGILSKSSEALREEIWVWFSLSKTLVLRSRGACKEIDTLCELTPQLEGCLVVLLKLRFLPVVLSLLCWSSLRRFVILLRFGQP